jgi:hypothetical protein
MNSAAWNRNHSADPCRAGLLSISALDFQAGASVEELSNPERKTSLGLAREGHRHIDIFRWRIDQDVMNGWSHGFRTGDVSNDDNGFCGSITARSSRQAYLCLFPRLSGTSIPTLNKKPQLVITTC